MSHWINALIKFADSGPNPRNSLFDDFMNTEGHGQLEPIESFGVHVVVEDFMNHLSNSQANSMVRLHALEQFKDALTEYKDSAKRVVEDCEAGLVDLGAAEQDPEIVG